MSSYFTLRHSRSMNTFARGGVPLRAYANGTEARQSLTRYFGFYNERRGAPGPRLRDTGRSVQQLSAQPE